MTKLLEQLKAISTNLIRAAEGIKQQIKQQGGKEIDDKKLMEMFVLPHLESQFREAQDKVLNDFEVEEYELEDGVTYYSKHGHKKIKEIADRIKLIYKEFGGEIDDEDDEDENDDILPTTENGQVIDTSSKKKNNGAVTHEQVVEVLESIVTDMTEMTDQYCSQYVATYGAPSTMAELQAFQVQYLTLSEQIETNAAERFNVPLLKFQKALNTYTTSGDTDVSQILWKLQELNIMSMQAHGIDFSKITS